MAELDNLGTDGARAWVDPGTGDAANVTLRVAGEVDIASVPALQPTVQRLIEQRPDRVVIDLTDVVFMDSSGIALLLALAAQVDSVELANPSSIVRRVIELAGLSTALHMTP
jgi:anti-sigma B factor antagonist